MFYCSKNTERTLCRCKVKTSRKMFRSKVKAMKELIRNNRNKPIKWLIEKINEKLRGHYQYYGVTDNIEDCKRYQRATRWYLYKYLNWRSPKRSYNQEIFFNGLHRTFPLANPRIRVSLAYRDCDGRVMWGAVCVNSARTVLKRYMESNPHIYLSDTHWMPQVIRIGLAMCVIIVCCRLKDRWEMKPFYRICVFMVSTLWLFMCFMVSWQIMRTICCLRIKRYRSSFCMYMIL